MVGYFLEVSNLTQLCIACGKSRYIMMTAIQWRHEICKRAVQITMLVCRVILSVTVKPDSYNPIMLAATYCNVRYRYMCSSFCVACWFHPCKLLFFSVTRQKHTTCLLNKTFNKSIGCHIERSGVISLKLQTPRLNPLNH
jgi:hypothetical protein